MKEGRTDITDINGGKLRMVILLSGSFGGKRASGYVIGEDNSFGLYLDSVTEDGEEIDNVGFSRNEGESMRDWIGRLRNHEVRIPNGNGRNFGNGSY